MEIRLGERVFTRDGKDAGVVDKVILNPADGQVNAVVLRQGTILHHDVEVSIEQLKESAHGILRVTMTAEALDDLPHFDPDRYTTPPSDVVAPPGYPVDTVLFPSGWAGFPVADEHPPYGRGREVEAEIVTRLYAEDLNNAVVGEGSAVMSRDGHKIGDIARMAFDDAGRVEQVVVRQGLLFTHDFTLPGSLVESASDGALYLRADQGQLKKMFHLE